MQYNYSRVNNNNVVLNDNYGRLRDLILLFRISMDMQNSFEVCRQFGHMPSKRLASPAIGTEDLECHTLHGCLVLFLKVVTLLT